MYYNESKGPKTEKILEKSYENVYFRENMRPVHAASDVPVQFQPLESDLVVNLPTDVTQP